MLLEQVLPFLRQGKWIARKGYHPIHLTSDGLWVEDSHKNTTSYTGIELLRDDWIVIGDNINNYKRS